MHCCLFVTVVASSTFVPTIIKEFYPHRSEQYIQTLSFPIYIAASGVCLLSAYLADRFKHRSGFCFIGGILILFGASILYNEGTTLTTLIKFHSLLPSGIQAEI